LPAKVLAYPPAPLAGRNPAPIWSISLFGDSPQQQERFVPAIRSANDDGHRNRASYHSLTFLIRGDNDPPEETLAGLDRISLATDPCALSTTPVNQQTTATGSRALSSSVMLQKQLDDRVGVSGYCPAASSHPTAQL
jgi:hypothetical protein